MPSTQERAPNPQNLQVAFHDDGPFDRLLTASREPRYTETILPFRASDIQHRANSVR
jgi:hypothetical protein